MPGNLATFSNPGGMPVATSADEFYQRQRLADQARNSQDAQLAAMLAMNGTYADKVAQQNKVLSEGYAHDDAKETRGYAHDIGMQTQQGANHLAYGKQANEGNLAIANVGAAPALGRLALDREKYSNEWNAGQPERDATRALFDYQGGFVNNANQSIDRYSPATVEAIAGMRDPNFLIQKDRSRADAARTAAETEQAKKDNVMKLVIPLLESGTTEGIAEAGKYLSTIGMTPSFAEELDKALPGIWQRIEATFGNAVGSMRPSVAPAPVARVVPAIPAVPLATANKHNYSATVNPVNPF